MKLHHVAIWVSDLAKMRSFYVENFCGTSGEIYKNSETGFSSYFIKFESGAQLELMNRPDIPEGKPETTGYAHMAFNVGSKDEVERVTDCLRNRGVPVISGPRTTGDGYFESCILDLEGNMVEITSA